MVFLSSTQSATYQRRRKKHSSAMRKTSRVSAFIEPTVKQSAPVRAGADHSTIPSAGVANSTNQCHRKESPKYTGTLVKGISTLHKSNAVPVISTEEMISHANMRR